MKTKLVLIVFAGLWIALLSLPQKAKTQITDTCWCMPKYYPPNGELFNEHFEYDTCGVKYASSSCDSIYWLNMNRAADGRNRIYAKREWDVWFDVKAFPLPYYPPDTIIVVTWRDVDSINYPEIKDSLKMIENEYGNYIMFKEHPDIIQPGMGQRFIVSFDSYENGVELENKFRSIHYAHCDFYAWTGNIDNIDDFGKGHYTEINIFPNPVKDILDIKGQMPFHAGKMQIISVEGIIVMETELKERLDVSGLAPGMYFLRINNIVKPFIIYR